ncbi:MAG TPA: RNA polymerase sigma factor [Streptosporangiaceae bacterium]
MTASSPRIRHDDAQQVELSLRDPECFGVVFDRYFGEIHGYVARRLGRDAADDVAAETFLAAFRSRRRFDASRGTVRAWLYGIVTNHMNAYHRQEVRAYRALERAGIQGAEEGHADRVAERIDAGAAGREVAGALAKLPRGDREVLLLVALGGLSHADIAAALGIPYGTVGSRLNRVRKKLRGLASVALEIELEDSGRG